MKANTGHWPPALSLSRVLVIEELVILICFGFDASDFGFPHPWGGQILALDGHVA
jgi:hypothetical protein